LCDKCDAVKELAARKACQSIKQRSNEKLAQYSKRCRETYANPIEVAEPD
jgi:hypothetical protein